MYVRSLVQFSSGRPCGVFHFVDISPFRKFPQTFNSQFKIFSKSSGRTPGYY